MTDKFDNDPFDPARRRWLGRMATLGAATMAAGAVPMVRSAPAAFPTRPVHIILPQAPGGAADRMIRLIAERLESNWGQSVLIEYKPGGGSILATQTVARSAPDGYTLCSAASSLTINAQLRKDLPYKMSDVLPIARIGYYTTVLVASPSLPVNDVRELIALAKTKHVLFGSNGVSSAAHLAGELMNQMGGVNMGHVPYNGASKLYNDMLGGRLELGFAIASSAEPFVKDGKLKVLGVTNPTRSPLFPDWPAISETLPGYEAVNWAGLIGPAGIPAGIAEQLSDDVLKVLKIPPTRKALTDMGVDVDEQGTAEFSAFLRRDIERIAPLSRRIGPLQ